MQDKKLLLHRYRKAKQSFASGGIVPGDMDRQAFLDDIQMRQQQALEPIMNEYEEAELLKEIAAESPTGLETAQALNPEIQVPNVMDQEPMITEEELLTTVTKSQPVAPDFDYSKIPENIRRPKYDKPEIPENIKRPNINVLDSVEKLDLSSIKELSGSGELKKIQEKLNELGITDYQGKPLDLDDKFGKRTQSAIRKYKRSIGLEPKTVEYEDIKDIKPDKYKSYLEDKGISIIGGKIEKPSKIDAKLINFHNETGIPISITSGYRDSARNKKAKGASKSYHLQKGMARDISTRDLTPKQVMKLMSWAYENGLNVIDERDRKGAPHIHLDARDNPSLLKYEKPLLSKERYVPHPEHSHKDGGIVKKYQDGGLLDFQNSLYEDTGYNSDLSSEQFTPEDLLTRPVQQQSIAPTVQDLPQNNQQDLLAELAAESPTGLQTVDQLNSPEDPMLDQPLSGESAVQPPMPKEPKSKLDYQKEMLDLYNQYKKIPDAMKDARRTAGISKAMADITDAASKFGAGRAQVAGGMKIDAPKFGMKPISVEDAYEGPDTSSLKGRLSLLKELRKKDTDGIDRKPYQQTKLVNKSGDPVVFDPNIGKHINAKTGAIEEGDLTPRHLQIFTDPETKEKVRVKPDGSIEKITGPEANNIKESAKTYYKMPENEKKLVDSMQDTFASETKATRESLTKVDRVSEKAIEAVNNPIAASQLGAEVATIFENGRLTDEDVLRYTRRKGIADRFVDALQEAADGTITREKAKLIQDTLKEYSKSTKKQLSLKAEGKYKALEGRLSQDYDKGDVMRLIYGDYIKTKTPPYGTRVEKDGKTYIWNPVNEKYQLLGSK